MKNRQYIFLSSILESLILKTWGENTIEEAKISSEYGIVYWSRTRYKSLFRLLQVNEFILYSAVLNSYGTIQRNGEFLSPNHKPIQIL